MQMLSHWIQDPSSDARIRVLEGSDASQTNSQVARITHTNAFVRVRPDTGDYPDALNWVRMGPGMAALSWCASMTTSTSGCNHCFKSSQMFFQ